MTSHHRPLPQRVFNLAPRAKLPTAGLPATTYEGVTYYVRPLAGSAPRRHRRMAHRMRALCPGCGRDLSAGRLRQHRCPKTSV